MYVCCNMWVQSGFLPHKGVLDTVYVQVKKTFNWKHWIGVPFSCENKNIVKPFYDHMQALIEPMVLVKY